MTPTSIAAALAALEAEGFAMRGRFTPGAGADEWCERRLLARIHRYTIKRLRAEIEPVAARDFLRFLFELAARRRRTRAWRARRARRRRRRSSKASRRRPARGRAEILPARLAGYEPAWLDDLCLAGRIAWSAAQAAQRTRQRQRAPRGAGAHHADHAAAALACVATGHRCRRKTGRGPARPAGASGRRLHCGEHGASFFDELVDGTGLLRTQVEEALAELVALGLVSSDSFGGLRALLVPSRARRPIGDRRAAGVAP